MRYFSTRGVKNFGGVSAGEAILRGIAPDGGLYVPERIPHFNESGMSLNELINLNYAALAEKILGLYLSDFTPDEIKNCAETAYGGDNFTDLNVAPLTYVKKINVSFLELFHGRTLAFKDMALSILPLMMNIAAEKTGRKTKTLILTATSGDTGKAALEGFANRPGAEIAVFYPENGISTMQKKQMITQRGENTFVVGVRGNFDDAQTGVKKLFLNENLRNDLAGAGRELSSANSINIGRLLPQIAYYFYAYGQMAKKNIVKPGEKINFSVPTGNFGNILAAFYAKKMGLPVNNLICASNENKILTDFINTGTYDKNREFHRTASPSMDILISSNLERFVHYFAGNKTAGLMNDLRDGGSFNFNIENGGLAGYHADDSETFAAIKKAWDAGYLIDTHTAVGYFCYEKYLNETRDETPCVIIAAASPYKFPEDVCRAISGERISDAFTAARKLSIATGVKIPGALTELESLQERHLTLCDPDEMEDIIRKKYIRRDDR